MHEKGGKEPLQIIGHGCDWFGGVEDREDLVHRARQLRQRQEGVHIDIY